MEHFTLEVIEQFYDYATALDYRDISKLIKNSNPVRQIPIRIPVIK